MELWATAFCRITKRLIEAVQSNGVDRKKQIATAARWYLGAPQLFFRVRRGAGANTPKVHRTNCKIIKRRLISFLAGNYLEVVSLWRRDVQNFKPRKKQQGPKSYEHQVEMAIRLMEKGRVSKGLKVLANEGVGDSDCPDVRKQMVDKMPAGTRVLGETDYAEAVSMAGIKDVLRKLDALVGVGARGLKAH